MIALEPQFVATVLILEGSACLQATVGFAAGLMGIPRLLWAGNTLPEAQVLIITAMLPQNALLVWKLRQHLDPWEIAAPAAHRAPRPRPAVEKALRRREPTPMAQPASCVRNASGPGCRKAVIQADRHLRNVYQTAIRRGVPREVLIDYRDRWADLRETDNDDPAHLIQGYGALAYDLGREARDDREGAERRRNPSGLRALANALAPWW